MRNISTSQDTAPVTGATVLTGPVVDDLAAGSSPVVAALDARWAAAVLAGQALDYAVTPGPADALRDVLTMAGLLVDEAAGMWRPGSTVGTLAGAARGKR